MTYKLSEGTFTINREGRKLPVFYAGPEGEKTLPGLIVVHEIFGLNDHIKDVARRFASTGFRVHAPDLFAGADNLPEDRDDLPSMREVWQSIPDSQLVDDMKIVFEHMAARDDIASDRIGTIGYCMGGAIAFMLAGSESRVAFVIDYYGRVRYPELSEAKPKHPVDYSNDLKAAVLGVFSGIDPLIPESDVELFREKVEGKASNFRLKIYPDAPHAFFNDQRENYREEAAKDAWRITLDFINSVVAAKTSG